TPQQIVDMGIKRIAQMLGKPVSEIDQQEVIYLNSALKTTEGYKIGHLWEKYRGIGTDADGLGRESLQIFHQSAELIEGGIPYSNSYGLYASSYESVLREQRNTWESLDYRSLLIGAMTMDTALEYTASVRSVFPKAKTNIIDLEGGEIKNAPGFIFADGLYLPFSSDSLSSIQTNYLFHALKSDNKGNSCLERIISESWRCLSDKGVLILCEGNFDRIAGCENISADMAINKICRVIKKQGFSDIKIRRPSKFLNRREIIRHYRSSGGANEEKTSPSQGAVFITATKKLNIIYL
ncbi:MAG TPA: hypothetical protein PLY70_14230, partial [Saprospiraceae bacterium]|nr:hypothetical protein [Saprospiraceae bacterium]